MLKIFAADSFYYVQSRGLMTERHAFAPNQISVASPGGVLESARGVATGAYFPSFSPHLLHSSDIIHTFLLDPSSFEARALSFYHELPLLFRASFQVQEELSAFTFTLTQRDVLTAALEETISELLPVQDPPPFDIRISQSIDYIKSLKVKRASVAELAEHVGLSPSWFLHLFKKEMKVTLRSYLMWRRCIEGGLWVARGASVTEAAHYTGFADAAHFSRVFKKMFGLTLSSALRDQMPVLVVDSTRRRAFFDSLPI